MLLQTNAFKRRGYGKSIAIGLSVLAVLLALVFRCFEASMPAGGGQSFVAGAPGDERVTEIAWSPDGAHGEGTDEVDETKAIKSVLMAQQDAWNQGDIDGFMRGYWKSESLTFSSGGTTTRSWQSTIDRYKKKYASREAMGVLAFDELEVHLLGDDAAFVLGRWELRDLAGGNFTLVMRKIDASWVVVHDHTSALDDE